MTGFRVAPGGAQQLFGIVPDLTTLGKVIGGGLPVGAFGGKAAIMDHIAPVGAVTKPARCPGIPLRCKRDWRCSSPSMDRSTNASLRKPTVWY